MPRVRFTADMDWSPKQGVTIAYRKGWSGMVVTPCADAAVAAGKAVRVGKAKGAADGSGQDEPAGARSEEG